MTRVWYDDHDHDYDPRWTSVVWALVFFGLGSFIAANLPASHPWVWLIVAGVSYLATAYFAARAIFWKDA